MELQPFSQKSRTPTAGKEFQIGLYDPAGRVRFGTLLAQLQSGNFGRTAVFGNS